MALSEQGLPPGVKLRPLAAADLPAACALSAEPGWNQIAADWRIFFDLGQAVALIRGETLIATAAMLPHGDSFAWISMVLVTKSEQRRGLARFLLRHCIDRLLEKGLRPVLDATPAGRAVYLDLGFRDGWGMRRLVAQSLPQSALPDTAQGTRIRPIAPADWPRLIAYDRAVFGAERGALLQRLALRLPAAALIAERAGALVGYSLGRDGRVMRQLGPLVAEDDAAAEALLFRALASVQAPLAIDVPDGQFRLAERLASLGFTVERHLTRMAHAGEPPGDDPRYVAIAGPELG